MTVGHALRAATDADAANVAALVDDAYEHWVERLGIVPRPMTDNYAEVLERFRVSVAERDGQVAGLVVYGEDEEGFVVDNVAVEPSHRGSGVGRALLRHAEAAAKDAGFDSVYLYTHELMTENIALYTRIGYVEYARRPVRDFHLVFMRKPLH